MGFAARYKAGQSALLQPDYNKLSKNERRVELALELRLLCADLTTLPANALHEDLCRHSSHMRCMLLSTTGHYSPWGIGQLLCMCV